MRVAHLLFRLVGPADDLRQQISDAVAGKAEAHFKLEIPYMEMATVPGIETMIAAFTTDIPALTNWGSRCSSARAPFTWPTPKASTSRRSSCWTRWSCTRRSHVDCWRNREA